MIKKWLVLVNYTLAAVIVLFILAASGLSFLRKPDILVSNLPPPKTALPPRTFAFDQASYDQMGSSLLSLQFAPLSQQLPDIKRYLIYYGKNGRPDAAMEKPLLHFAFTGNKTLASVLPGERLYILYDPSLNPAQYIFSPANHPTSLWMEATAQGNEAVVTVAMQGDQGEIIKEPETLAKFNLPEKEFMRFGGTSAWEIGKNRVDATLLARQRAKWYGLDVFFERHGGPEYSDFVGKQRLDFGEGDTVYSVFANLNDALIWENEQWHVVKPGSESLGKPLLLIKRIDERLLNLELWDPEGKAKVILNLLKITEAAIPLNLLQQFKFVGSRTRSQFIFEINKKRFLLSPHDWLLLTKEGWVKLITPEEIDDYVNRKVTGPLFVFDAIESQEGKQYLKGTLFNTSRTEMQPVEIPLQQFNSTSLKPIPKKTTSSSTPLNKIATGLGAGVIAQTEPPKKETKKEEEEDDDDEDDNDEDEDDLEDEDF